MWQWGEGLVGHPIDEMSVSIHLNLCYLLHKPFYNSLEYQSLLLCLNQSAYDTSTFTIPILRNVKSVLLDLVTKHTNTLFCMRTTSFKVMPQVLAIS